MLIEAQSSVLIEGIDLHLTVEALRSYGFQK